MVIAPCVANDAAQDFDGWICAGIGVKLYFLVLRVHPQRRVKRLVDGGFHNRPDRDEVIGLLLCCQPLEFIAPNRYLQVA